MSFPVIDPFRIYKRRRRLAREAMEEVHYLRRRHGEHALSAARDKLASGDLTSWGRRVMQRAVRLLQRELH